MEENIMAIKVNDWSYRPPGHYEDITVSGSYHNITQVRYVKNGNMRDQNVIVTSVYRNNDYYTAGSSSIQQLNWGVAINSTSSFGSNISFLSGSYELLKSEVPLYSGSKHVVDVL